MSLRLLAWIVPARFDRTRNGMRFLALLIAILLQCSAFGQQATLSADAVEAVVTTELGEFRFEFAPDKAPEHVQQFIQRATEGYYDGSAFFRMVANGIIQGGDPLLKDPQTARNQWGTGGLNLLKGELSDLKHERGTVSTVRIPDKPDSDGAQFFVCVHPQPVLDGQYSAFGRVTEGMEVVERISQTPITEDGNAVTPVRIHHIRIEKRKVAPFADATEKALRRTVVMETTLGTLRIATKPEWALEHARQFLNLVAEGWYDGVGFHRIAPGFVVQGGMGYYRQPSQTHRADRWVKTLKAEFREDVQHVRGTVSMAHGDDPNSATTSFFLVLGEATHLDGNYSAFGEVVEGIDVLDAFEQEPVDDETPRRQLKIIRAWLEPE